MNFVPGDLIVLRFISIPRSWGIGFIISVNLIADHYYVLFPDSIELLRGSYIDSRWKKVET